MIPDGYKSNFNTLQRTFSNGDAALVECTDNRTGAPVFTVCAVQRREDGSIEMVPLAKLFDGNPYEELNPPE